MAARNDGTFSNGKTQVLARVAVAGFTNPGGLEKAGSSAYRPSVNSGDARIGTAGSDGLGGFDVCMIDEVVHGRLRLGILSLLSRHGAADFMRLRSDLKASDGNLASHLRTLEQAGYVWVEKRFQDRKPLTRIVLSEAGRQAFRFYLETMARLVADHAREAA